MRRCCERCFNSKTLREYIRENGSQGECGFCGSERVRCIDPEELHDLFRPVIGLYRTVEDFMPLEDLKSGQYDDAMIDKLDSEWGLFPYFGDDFDQRDVEQSLLEAVFPEDPRHGEYYPFLHSSVEKEDEYWGLDESRASERLTKRWEEFCVEIKTRSRFLPQTALDFGTLRKLLSYCGETIQSDTTLYRARISHDGAKHPAEGMGKPPAEESISGRANPQGIPYLYVSSSVGTAIAEVRPLVKDEVTVGSFELLQRMDCLDLRRASVGDPFRYGDRLDEVADYLAFVATLGRELSRTVSRRESEIEYVPTQYLSEFIRGLGYDGIVYGSSMVEEEDEYNVVVFHDEKLECVSARLFEIAGIRHTYRERRSP